MVGVARHHLTPKMADHNTFSTTDSTDYTEKDKLQMQIEQYGTRMMYCNNNPNIFTNKYYRLIV